jgi:hypothetical protein
MPLPAQMKVRDGVCRGCDVNRALGFQSSSLSLTLRQSGRRLKLDPGLIHVLSQAGGG